jgi:hypothetical protein
MFEFYLTDVHGSKLVEAVASDYITMVVSARTLRRAYPGSALTCHNLDSGAVAVFVAAYPDYVTYGVDQGPVVEIYGSFTFQSDADIWAHLTENGYYDPGADPLNFLGDPDRLEKVRFSERIVLN